MYKPRILLRGREENLSGVEVVGKISFRGAADYIVFESHVVTHKDVKLDPATLLPPPATKLFTRDMPHNLIGFVHCRRFFTADGENIYHAAEDFRGLLRVAVLVHNRRDGRSFAKNSAS